MKIDLFMCDLVLSIGITTFNREKELRANLEIIADASLDFIECVYIVNHGNQLSFSPSEILSNVIVIEQPNFGGAGGFTRTMLSSLDGLGCKRKPTHHLIMDDDVLLNSTIFEGLADAIRQNTEACFGGHMRNKENPDIIAEMGVKITKTGNWVGVGRNQNINSHQTKVLLNSPPEIDAHAWWFWVVPAAVMEKAKLPLPVFIKGDDIEYSYRCKTMGHATKILPDIHVIHPAIAKKGADWRYYYLARNNAIFCAVSDEVRLPRHYALFRILSALLRHEYYRVDLEIKGIQDFLEGPDLLLKKRSDTLHHELISYQQHFEKPARKPASELPKLNGGKPEILRYFIAAIYILFCRSNIVSNFVWDSQNPVDPLKCAGKGYELYLSGNKQVEQYPFERQKYFAGLKKMLPIVLKFFVFSQKAAKAWANAKPELTSREYWNRQFSE